MARKLSPAHLAKMQAGRRRRAPKPIEEVAIHLGEPEPADRRDALIEQLSKQLAAMAGEIAALKATVQPKPVKAPPAILHPVQMRVSSWGHMEISNGEEDGFGRFPTHAEFTCEEEAARSLYDKRWAEPVDAAYVERWVKLKRREAHQAHMRYQAQREAAARGISAEGEAFHLLTEDLDIERASELERPI